MEAGYPKPSETSNATMNFTANDLVNNTFIVGFLTAYILTCIIGVVGNGLVIFIFGYFAQLRTRAYGYYIWNLSFADLLFTLTLPFFCISTYYKNWLFGDFMCKVAHVLRETNKFASVFTLAALSLDRYLASYYSVGQWRTPRTGIITCMFIWIACGIISIPFWMHAEAVTDTTANGSHYECTKVWPEGHVGEYMTFWTFFQLTLGLIVPFITIAYSYIRLAVRLGFALKSNTSHAKVKSSARMAKMILVVVVTFLVCQTPYHAVEILSWRTYKRFENLGIIPSEKEKGDFIVLNTVAQVLVFISCCCNPIIYGLVNTDYRKFCSEHFRKKTRFSTKTSSTRSSRLSSKGSRRTSVLQKLRGETNQ